MSIERQNIADTLGGYQLKSHDEMIQRRSEAKSAMQEWDENVEGVPGPATWKPQQPTDQQRSEADPHTSLLGQAMIAAGATPITLPPQQQRSEAVTEIVFGPNNLSQSEQEWRAIAAGNRLAEQVMFWHTKDCNVHAPTLKPCSCGLETRMRQLIADQSAIIAERDRTIAELEALRIRERQDWMDKIAALQARVAELEAAGKTAVRLIHSKEEQIGTLQARVTTLEEVLQNIERFESGPMSTMESVKTHLRNMARAAKQPTPTTEK